jgi:uncharacterized integral membrane protein
MQRPPAQDARAERILYALVAGLALVVIYLVAFVVSNTREVLVSFVFFEATASLIWVMLACTLLGLAAGVAIVQIRTRRRALRRGAAPALEGPRATATAPAPGATKVRPPSPDAPTERLP